MLYNLNKSLKYTQVNILLCNDGLHQKKRLV